MRRQLASADARALYSFFSTAIFAPVTDSIMHLCRIRQFRVAIAVALLAAITLPLRAEENISEVSQFLAAHLKTRSGPALDLGCGNASLDIALAKLAPLNLECISSEQNSVTAARESFLASGLYGTHLSANRESTGKLNYPDSCMSLIFASDQFVTGYGDRDLAEIVRVLSPNGVALLGQSTAVANHTKEPLTRAQLETWLADAHITSFEILEEHGVWARITKPFAPGWDDWTHRMHDAANTYSSRDDIAGNEFKAKWVSDYRPGLSSAAVTIAGGKVVIASLSYADEPNQTPYIQALDAFTGVELWSRVGKKNLPIERPPGVYSNRESCSDIALAGNALYLLGSKFCHVFDLETGATSASFPIPPEAKADEADVWLYLSVDGDTLFGGVGKPPGVKVDWSTMHYRGVCSAVFAMNRTDGKLLWIKNTPVATSSLAAAKGLLYCCDSDLKLHAFQQKDGTETWTSGTGFEAGSEVVGTAVHDEKLWVLHIPPEKDQKGNLLAALELVVRGRNTRVLDAFSTTDGKHLFTCDFGQTIAGFSFAGDTVVGARQHGAQDAGGQGMGMANAKTGAFIWLEPPGVKLRCTPTLATPNLVLRRGPGPNQVIDFKSINNKALVPKVTTFAGFRSSCTYPAIPAYNLLFVQGEGCACQSPIRGNIALTPGTPAPPSTTERLTQGPAFGEPIPIVNGPGWASWRNDVTRSGQSNERTTTPLHELWSAQLAGTVAPVAAAQGLVYCASTDHTLTALDLTTGKLRWRTVADRGISVAPSWANGRLYFSDDAGFAYALRAADGAELWRFRAALSDERMMGYGRLVSRWPAWGGVLVHNGVAYVPSGYFPDEGGCVYALDAVTGAQKWKKQIDRHENNYRTGFVARGAMAFSNNRLYLATGAGIPWALPVAVEGHKPELICGTRDCHIKGEHIMLAGENVITVAPDLEYVHHVKAIEEQHRDRLPVLTADAVFLLNQTTGAKSTFLISGKRSAFEYAADGNTATFMLKDDFASHAKDALNWSTWKDEPMTTLIKAGEILFSGGEGKVYATRASDGTELWSAAVPGGEVTDLALEAGHLLVVTRAGIVVCFVP